MTVTDVDKKLTELRQQFNEAVNRAAGRDVECIRLHQQIQDWTEFRAELKGNAKDPTGPPK